MKNPDNFVMQIIYESSKGETTKRVISPVKYGPNKETIFALCLAREEVRQFRLDGIRFVRVINANKVLMPIQIENVHLQELGG